jgi:uncharacterized protein (UPF0147 family)
MNNDAIQVVIENLSLIEEDLEIPKNIRCKVKEAIGVLLDDKTNISLRVNRSIEELSEIADDPNLQPYIRMQLWSIVSQLESK